jgi:hypothetical protein
VHHRNDPGESGGSPPFAIEVNDGSLQIVARSGTAAIRTSNPAAKVLWKDDAPLQQGKWYDMKFELKFDPFGNGIVNAWIDGNQELAYKGAIGYNDKEGGYLKMGIYRSASPGTIAVKYDNVEMAEGTAASDASPPISSSDDQDNSIRQDAIDVSGYDAQRGVRGDQAFVFIGEKHFTKAGQLRFYQDADEGITVIEGNTDADLRPEVHIKYDGLKALHASDFIL